MIKQLIAANWKMNKDIKESVSFINEFKNYIKGIKNAEILICPPFTLLSEIKKIIRNTNIKLGAQNMHFEEKGAFTGEISALMLKDAGCEYVILGHSERREIFNENDDSINKKIIASLNHSLRPILCVGENLEQKQGGRTKEIIESQLKNCLKGVGEEQILDMDIAYEPIWAISKGNPNHKAATAQDAEEGHNFIRTVIAKAFGEDRAKNARIIYGGSMKPENAKELLSMPNINGGLVGNASLDAKSFAEICSAKNN